MIEILSIIDDLAEIVCSIISFVKARTSAKNKKI